MKKIQAKCPQCGKATIIDQSNPFRPFCCERCKLIDLGNWASESYKIPTQESGSISDEEQKSD